MASTHATIAAPVLEVFASIQGEGKYVGEPQVFLRLAGCPVRCKWCDTPGSWAIRSARSPRIARAKRALAPHAARASSGSDSADESSEPDTGAWASPFQAAVWIAEAEPGDPRTLSVTGGEPLLWPDFLLALQRMIGARRMHLETGGAHPETLARVVDAFDHVSLDLKLPRDMDPPVEIDRSALPGDEYRAPSSEPTPSDEAEWALARRRALQLLRHRDACAKIVVAADRAALDFEPLLEDVARFAPDLPVYVAPATPCRDVLAPSIEAVVEVAEAARELGLTARVLPQVHRLLQIP